MSLGPDLTGHIWQEVISKPSVNLQTRYSRISIKDNDEPIVPCINYGLISKDYYLNKLLLGEKAYKKLLDKKILYPFALLRLSLVETLQKVDQELRKHGLFLVVNGGWRHSQTQKLAQETYAEKYRYASVKVNGKRLIPPHSTGGACDLELWSLQLGNPLSFSHKDDKAIEFYQLEIKGKLTKAERMKRDIRRILYNLLTVPKVFLKEDELLAINPKEFWHFGFGDQMSAYLQDKKFAVYGEDKPDMQYLVAAL